MWMNDKAGIAANQDYGRDEDAAVKALKKHRVRATTMRHKGASNCRYRRSGNFTLKLFRAKIFHSVKFYTFIQSAKCF